MPCPAAWPRPRVPVLCLGFLLLLLVAPVQAKTVTDMDGLSVTVPDAPKRVYTLSPPDTLLVYAVAPCLLAGWNYPLPGTAAPYLDPCVRGLPVLGGFFGQAMTPNKESLVKAAPDIVVSGTMAKPHRGFECFFADLHIPVVHIDSESPEEYAKDFRFLGEVLGHETRGEALAAYAESTLADLRQGLATIPENKRLTVYYAEGGDGLYTDGRGSFHTLVLDLAGGLNVHPTPQSRRYGMDKVTLETVIGYAPQVILVQDAACRDMILASPVWKTIPAVQQGRVYLIPDKPLNWFDRPPSFMRLLGLKWLANILYPETFPSDMVQETRTFMKLFLGKDLTDAEARALLDQKAVPKP
ncbi:MAG: ABC transporter substrate-binding protein [Desulfovibrionaceae bacterium]